MSVYMREPTPEQRNKLLEALRVGNYLDIAAKWAGIDGVRLKLALEEARKAQQPSDQPRRHRIPIWLRLLLHDVEQAETHAHVSALTKIMAKAKQDPRHAEWFLERKDPQQWGKVERMELTGRGGGPVELSLVDLLTAAHKRRREQRDE